MTDFHDSHKKLPISIDLTANEHDLQHAVHSLVTTMLSYPAGRKLTISRLSGGITNVLMVVKDEEEPENTVIVRFFGPNTHHFIDRETENMIFHTLSELQFGPKFHGLFENGRVEGYFHARSLTSDEMSNPAVYRAVAKRLFQLHQVSIPSLHAPTIDTAHSWLWKKLALFFDLAAAVEKGFTASTDSALQAKAKQIHALNLPKMKGECEWLQHFVAKIVAQLAHHVHDHEHVHPHQHEEGHACGEHCGSSRDRGMGFALQAVLCHNDLLAGNILRLSDAAEEKKAHCAHGGDHSCDQHDHADHHEHQHEHGHEHGHEHHCDSHKRGECHGHEHTHAHKEQEHNHGHEHSHQSEVEVRFIDYEYTSYNYRAFDVANHFCEFAGFEFDINNKYPSSEVRRDFITHYLKASHVKDVFDEDFIDGFENIIEMMTVATHLFWGTWSIVQAGNSAIDFDYLGYAKLRFDAYNFHKDLFDLN